MSDSAIRDDDFDIYSDPHYLTELISDDELKAAIERSYHIERDPGEAGGWVYHTLLSALGRILRLEAQIARLSEQSRFSSAVEKERERCLQIIGDRITAARVGELDADLRSIYNSVEHDISYPIPATEQEKTDAG